MNIFEKASRMKLRIETIKGNILVEDLWDIPLVSKNGYNLDSIAIAVNKSLKDSECESFVMVKTQENEVAKLKLDLVKHVIDFKLKAQREANENVVKKEHKNRLMKLITEKEDEKLKGKSLEELKTELENL